MTRRVLIIGLGAEDTLHHVTLIGHELEVRRMGCRGDPERARDLVAQHDGEVDAIGLDGAPFDVRLGTATRAHSHGRYVRAAANRTPVVDGAGIRDGLERWAVTLADRREPGIFSQKRVLMVPGFNHGGLASALSRHSPALRYADPVTHLGVPYLPGVGTRATLDRAAGPTVDRLSGFPWPRLYPAAHPPHRAVSPAPFEWADVLAGDVRTIRRFAPSRLDRKTVVVEWAAAPDVEDLRERGAAILVTLMPSLDGHDGLAGWSAAGIEAMLVAVRANRDLPLNEDTYLDLIARFDWAPAIRYLRPDEAGINRFAFVIHPLNVSFINKDRRFTWTRFLPDALVEAAAAYMPPVYLSRIVGAQSASTGQRVEGFLISLAATPRQMLAHGERFTYTRLNQAARMAERFGARIMGLGAFTSVVGDAGVTVAHEADIAITSGNSLTVAATLEAAKQAVIKMGARDLSRGKAMIVGATGSIGAVCARLLAQAINDVVLVSIEPEKLIDLKRRIQQETPGAQVTIATRTEDVIAECDLIVTATSAFGQRVIDISRCRPGAVICDVARPPDIGEREAAVRPDVLVIESGEVLIPGEVDFGYDIGLPPGTSYACLAETALLAMEGRFEDYTLGRQIDTERVKEIYRLFKKHGFQLAGLRSFGRYVTDDDVAERRRLADELRADAARFEALQEDAAERLARLPAMSKGVATAERPRAAVWIAAGATAAGLALALAHRRRRRKERA
jgi:predicted amino acid dehydrogenase